MRTYSAMPLAVALAGIALVVGGCESTQDKSAKIAAELGPVAQEKGLTIRKENEDVKVVSTTLLSDANGTAVVVELRNESNRALADVPLLIDVSDGKGKSVYRNDIPGIEPALAAVPYVPAGGDVFWVHDQVLTVAKPDSVKAKVGAGGEEFSGGPPAISVSEPKLESDRFTGVAAGGEVVNESGEDVERLLLYAVARKGGKIVAAGRGAIEPLKDKPKPVPYNIYFIGDPGRADVSIEEFPTLPGIEAK